jgi:transcription antitermination factor NusA-like protein
MLCQDCERKLEEGKISQLDVEASRVLYGLAQEHHSLGKISFKRALREGGLTILVIEQDEISPAIGQEGRLAQEISKHLKTKIRVVKENTNVRELAHEILIPARVKGINVLFKRDGEEHRVRVTRADLMLLPASIAVLQVLLTKITDKKIKLVFE